MASVNDLLILCGQYEKTGGISPPALTPGGRHATNLRLPGADGGDRDHKSQDNHQKTLGERVGPEAGAGPPRVPDVWKRDGRWVCCTGVGQQSPITTIEDPNKIAKPASEQIDARRREMRIVADAGHCAPALMFDWAILEARGAPGKKFNAPHRTRQSRFWRRRALLSRGRPTPA